ncbi:MAG: helix-hairpin-helix domain-containing protein [Chitinophagales bacterium]|nr:hypothetical protein [Bacteroidota bacterium]MCB9044453.1 hypothetical protein [Chitinophagales bacterium]
MSIILLSCTSCTLQILAMLLGAFLLGMLFCWFICAAPCKKRQKELEDELERLRRQNAQLNAELANLNLKNTELHSQVNALSAKTIEDISHRKVETKVSYLVGGIDYAILKNDNLQVVEGIGPQIEAVLKSNNISTWGMLSATSEEKLKGFLDAAGDRFKLADPHTWPEQARLANANEWEKLIEYQKFLGGGRDDVNVGGGIAKVEKFATKLFGRSLAKSDDLKLIEGIGPKIEEVLKRAGIKTWHDLANSSAHKIKDILTAAGGRFALADPDTWPKQAQMAVDGKWQELDDYQDYLDGGRDPNKIG